MRSIQYPENKRNGIQIWQQKGKLPLHFYTCLEIMHGFRWASHSNHQYIPISKIFYSEKYLIMLNDGEIVSVGVARQSKPMHYYKTGIKV